MKNLLIIMPIILILTGCTSLEPTVYMTNDEIIAETKKCREADMFPRQVISGFSDVIHVICDNKEQT